MLLMMWYAPSVEDRRDDRGNEQHAEAASAEIVDVKGLLHPSPPPPPPPPASRSAPPTCSDLSGLAARSASSSSCVGSLGFISPADSLPSSDGSRGGFCMFGSPSVFARALNRGLNAGSKCLRTP